MKFLNIWYLYYCTVKGILVYSINNICCIAGHREGPGKGRWFGLQFTFGTRCLLLLSPGSSLIWVQSISNKVQWMGKKCVRGKQYLINWFSDRNRLYFSWGVKHILSIAFETMLFKFLAIHCFISAIINN